MSSIVHTKKAQDILKNYRINFNEDLDQIFDINKFKTKIPTIIKDEMSEESQRVFYSSLVTEAIANISEFLNKNPNFSIKNLNSNDLEELRIIFDPLISCNIKLYFIYLERYYTHLLEKLKDLNELEDMEDTKTNSDSGSIEDKITYFKYFYHYLENRPEFDPFLRPGQYSASDLKDKIENGLNLLLKEIENSGLFNPIFLTDTDIYIDTLDTTLLYFLKECKKDFQKLFDTLPKVISFEGVDATGKGTFSKTLELVLNAVGTVGEVSTVSIEAKRINVPDYNTYYGKNIKNRLETSTDITSLIELDNTIYTFALNRKEILNDLQRMGSAGKKKKNITIFDRQTTSSCAFTCGKLLTEAYTKYNKSILIKSNSIGEKKTLKEIIFGLLKFDTTDTQDTKNPQDYPANQNILTILFELFDYIYKVYYTEFDILSNVKPNLEVFCFSDLDTIQKRIQLRRKTTNPDTNPDNDVHKKDAHEDNFKIIEFTNAIYAFIYDISTVYKELREKCQKLNYSKKETDSVLWFETVKVLEEYIITLVDDNDIREEYIKRINNYQNLFTIWFNYQETVMIYNDFENYKENSILNFSEKIIFNMIQYMHTINQNDQNNQTDQTNSN